MKFVHYKSTVRLKFKDLATGTGTLPGEPARLSQFSSQHIQQGSDQLIAVPQSIPISLVAFVAGFVNCRLCEKKIGYTYLKQGFYP